MPGDGKEIRIKITSVQNTKKITKAMEMVAGSKMRKTQQKMQDTVSYLDKLTKVITNITSCSNEYNHPYTVKRDKVKKVGIIVISTDRGLCGGLNSNLFRALIKKLKKFDENDISYRFAIYGNKALTFFKSYGGDVFVAQNNIGDTPHFEDVVAIAKSLIREFNKGEIDEVYVAGNSFVNTMTQQPIIKKLIPIEQPQEEHNLWSYIYEPDAKDVLDALFERYIEGYIYGKIVENLACEQSARMIAMKNATDNAGKMIDELQLAYNKARQAGITQELSEIVAGATAI